MSHYPKKPAPLPLLNRETQSGLGHDITWNRPVFHPPQLPNLRVIFDPLPFTAHRLTAGPHQTSPR